jgi:hypothetical protein
MQSRIGTSEPRRGAERERRFGSSVSYTRGDLRPWEGPCTEAWAALDWVPSGELRCTYSVEANPDDFVVLGRCDIDGDGEESQWSASRDDPPTMDSANNVY